MSLISRRRLGALTALAGLGVVAAGCSTGNPLGTASSTASSTASGAALVIGSQQYYSNEIIAELYAQALESGP